LKYTKVAMDILNISINDFQIFFLILVRISAIFTAAPVFNNRSIPVPVKICFSFMVTLLLFPVIGKGLILSQLGMLSFFSLILKELCVGLVLGFAATFVFNGIQLSGLFIGRQMALQLSGLFDPVSGTQDSSVGQLNLILGSLVFLLLNGHHWLLKAFIGSYDLVALTKVHFTSGFAVKFIQMSSQVFVIAFQFSAPIYVTLVLLTMVMGIVSRLIPEMNILILSIPFKISIGLIMMAVSMPFFVYVFKKLFVQLNIDLDILLRSLG